MADTSSAQPPVPPKKTPNDKIFERFLTHPFTSFDEAQFMDFLEHSLSLSTFEKKRVIDAIPTLSQFQIDELIKVFENERVDFRNLMASEGEVIKGLVIKAQTEWEQLKEIYEDEARTEAQAAQDEAKAEALKQQLGIE